MAYLCLSIGSLVAKYWTVWYGDTIWQTVTKQQILSAWFQIILKWHWIHSQASDSTPINNLFGLSYSNLIPD